MAALATHLEQLKLQQEELQKRIQDEKEQKRLKQIGQLSHLKKLNDNSNEFIKTSGHRAKYTDVRTKRIIIFSTTQKFETLYEILKKQDERIKELVERMDNIENKTNSLLEELNYSRSFTST